MAPRFFKQFAEQEGIRPSPSHDERLRQENRWVEGLRRDDEASFEHLYRFYYPRLGQYLLRQVRSKRDVEDILHSIFLSLWKNRSSLQPSGTLRAYLYRAARNRAINHQQRESEHRELPADIPEPVEMDLHRSDTLEYREFEEAFQKALSNLPEKRRQIFLMHRTDQLTYREIAEILEISIKTVESQMRRSLQHFEQKLEYFI
ncbi:MAG: RNA polymerase sigma-70 factor [Balneolaceae bacterium]